MSLRNRLEKVEKQAPGPPELPWRCIVTHRRQPCILHTEPGPEMYEAEDGTEQPVTEALNEQWEREGVSVIIRQVYVGNCHTNGCDASLPGAERWR